MSMTAHSDLSLARSRADSEVAPLAATPCDSDSSCRSDKVFDISLAGRCIPAGPAGQPIAGDFYDGYALDRHRLLVTVGDVAGHGCGAGARMSELRAAARRLARQTTSPAELLTALDKIQARAGDVDDIATMWIGIYDCETDCIRYASAGHPPPVIAEIATPPRLLAEATAPPLGTGAVGAHVTVDEVPFPPGALLVAYSDGLVERPEHDLEAQLHKLRDLVGRTPTPPAGDATPADVADVLLNALVPNPSSARDDICILVLRRECRA